MNKSRTLAIALWVGLTFLPALGIAQPSGAIVAMQYQDNGSRRVVAAVSDRGIVFLGDGDQPFRAFRSRALSQEGEGRPFFWFEDVDEDRKNEYIFAGNPSFVLDDGGDPLFGVLQGCDDFYTGDIIGDDMVEVFCRRRNTLTVWNYDGQFLWEYSVTGARIGTCTADDVDQDEHIEFACESGSAWLLVDIENEEPVQEVDYNPAEVELHGQFEEWAREAQAALTGERNFDLDGDGGADETLLWNAGTLTLLDASGATMGSAALPLESPYSVAVGDLTGDGAPEVFVGGAGRIYVVGNTGTLLAEVSGDPGSLERDARVTIESANANGLEDSSAETTRAAVEDGLSRIQRCYRNQMGSDQFIRVGSMFYELGVDDRGRVDRTQRIHSGVENEDLEECVENALEALRFSPAAEGGGTVSVRLGFDFVDR